MSQSAPDRAEVFSALLDARARVAGPMPDARPRVRIAPVHGIDDTREPQAAAHPGSAAEALGRIYGEDEPPALDRPPPGCEREAVASELGLSPDLSERQIERIRRKFALANHPDRMPASERDLATRRMTVANMLIDQALRERKSSGRR